MFAAQRNISSFNFMTTKLQGSAAIYQEMFAPESYSSIDLSRRPPKEEEKCKWISPVIQPVLEAIKEEEEEEEWSLEQKALFVPMSYSLIDLTRKFPKEEKCKFISSVIQPVLEAIQEEEEEEEWSPEQRALFVPMSYSFIDLTRKFPKEEKCKSISPVIQPVLEAIKEEEEDEWSLEQKAFFVPMSYSLIDLTRKIPKEKECSLISSVIHSESEVAKVQKEEVEELSPEQKLIFAPQSYASIDLSRKPPKQDECSWKNYLDHPESDVEEEKIPEDNEELSEEQKALFAPVSYASIDLTKRNYPRDSGFPKNESSQLDIQLLAAVEVPTSENVAESSENLAPKSPENSDVQPPAKIPRKNRKVNTSFVMQPVKKIEGETPQRPFPKELYWHNPAVSGTASEIFDMLFKQSSNSQSKPKYISANFSAPASALQILEQARQKALQTSKGTPKDQQKPREQRKVLQSVQNTLWLVHAYKKDAVLEKTLKSMLQKFSCTRGDDGRLRIMNNGDLSITWNLSQRESDWKMRPVYIDGLSIADMVSGSVSTGLPMLQLQILMEILLHFTIDGHQVTLILPEVYKTSTEKIDDLEIFEFLCTLDVIKFINKKSRKAVESEVLAEAERTAGIICTNSDDLHTVSSVQCFPVIQKISNSSYTVSTVFAQKASDSTTESNLDSTEKYRLYSKNASQIDTPTLQLTLERQALIISSLIHITNFHGQRQQQIEVFLMAISRFLPEILPKIMQKSMITKVGEAIEMIQAEKSLGSWHIFLK